MDQEFAKITKSKLRILSGGKNLGITYADSSCRFLSWSDSDRLISLGEYTIVRRSMKRRVFKQERTSQLTWTMWSQINNGHGLLQAVTDVR